MTTSIALSVSVLNAALNERFRSPDEDNLANKLLSTLRYQFGGHEEKTAVKNGSD
jgi:6-phosphogluconate dehydrogenase